MTLDLLVTNVAALADDGIQIVLNGLTEGGDRRRVYVDGYRPHIYAPLSETESQERWLLSQESVSEIDYDHGFTSLFGEEVARIYLNNSRAVREVGEWFETSYQADIWSRDKFRIQSGVRDWVRLPVVTRKGGDELHCTMEDIRPLSEDEAPDEDPDPRVCVLDIEVDDRAEGFPDMGEERILSIVATRPQSEDCVGFIDLDGRAVEDAFPDGRPEGVDELRFFRSESAMLSGFADYISDIDPDVMTGWNFDDFDAPFLIQRMENLNVNLTKMSPFRQGWVTDNGAPVIKGRSIYDLLKAYKSNSRGELDSHTLDSVAKAELGEAKISHEKGFFALYRDNPTKLINYNARDTKLTSRINKEAGVLKFRNTLRKIVGVDWEATVNPNDFVEMMVRRKMHSRNEVGPTGEYQESEDYEGGYVFDPFEGVADNVMEIDISSQYPVAMRQLNLSPEVKLENDREGEDHYKAPNGARFSKETDGLFRVLVDDVIDLSNKFKAKRREAESREEHEYWARKYAAAKVVRNSLYGVLGWEHFFLYDKATAKAITQAGQSAIKWAAEYVESQGFDIIYGDTDSVYISFPSPWSNSECLWRASWLCGAITNEVYPNKVQQWNVDSDSSEWKMEMESFSKRFFQAGKKKRYGKKLIWEDGEYLPEPEIDIAGFGSQRSDSSRLHEKTEEQVIEQLLEGDDESEIVKTVFDASSQIAPTGADWELIGMPSGIGQPLDEYDSPTAHVRGARVANNVLGTTFGEGSKPLRMYIEPVALGGYDEKVDVICYNTEDDLRPVKDKLRIDVQRMLNKTIEKPLGRILGPVGIDVEAAVSGMKQTGLEAF